MALATRCPHCRTTFRVAQDQLKLRAGLVRCGACKQIFNGADNLLDIDPAPGAAEDAANRGQPAAAPAREASYAAGDQSPQTAAGAAPAAGDAPAMPAAPAGTPAREELAAPAEDNPEIPLSADHPAPAAAAEPRIDASAGQQADPLQRMTLMDFAGYQENESEQHEDAGAAHAQADSRQTVARDGEAAADAPQGGEEADDLERTIDELQRKPWRKPKKRSRFSLSRSRSADPAEPDFVRHARRQQRFGKTMRIALSAGSFILLLALAGQFAYAFRDQIAARFPQSRPALIQACSLIGCGIGLPAQIDLVSIEASDLQAAGGQDDFLLTALLRNRSALAQAWPDIELTLNDTTDKPVARRVFRPREYLPGGQDPAKGFAPNSEQAIRLGFAVSELKPSGYRIYLFYP